MIASRLRLRVAAAALAASVALGGCARSPDQVAAHDESMRALAAQDAKLSADNPQFALTPPNRRSIALTVAGLVKSSWLWRASTYDGGEISQLKMEAEGDFANRPYYCVKINPHQPLNPISLAQYYRVTPTSSPNGFKFHVQHAVTVAGTDHTVGCDAAADVNTPFPEVIAALHGAGPVAPLAQGEPQDEPAERVDEPPPLALPAPVRQEALGPAG